MVTVYKRLLEEGPPHDSSKKHNLHNWAILLPARFVANSVDFHSLPKYLRPWVQVRPDK